MAAHSSTDGDPMLGALTERVRQAAATKTPLAIRGGGTKAWYGHRVEGEPFDVRGYAGVVDYEPTELVITARAGTPLAEIEAALAEHNQMFAFEPAKFESATPKAMLATLGGCVAAVLSGPRRQAAGSVRDFVLGVKLIDGRGQALSFGGKVIKNVAGYDVSRALVGSLGTLGIIVEASLKVLPRPEACVSLQFAMNETTALTKLNEWAAMPIAITASAWRAAHASSRSGTLTIRLEGSEAAVQSAIRRVGGLDVEPEKARTFWAGIREQTDDFFAQRPADAPLWRFALPSTAQPLDAQTLAFSDQLIEWGGALRWITTREDAHAIRSAASLAGGHATLYRASDQLKTRHGVFQPLAPEVMAIHQRLKAEFDPHRIFNRGRMYAGL